MEANQIIYPIVDPQEWAERYNLTVKSAPCENCGRRLHPTKPFAAGRWRGLVSEPHGCEDGFNISVAKKATQEERNEIIGYLDTLKTMLG